MIKAVSWVFTHNFRFALLFVTSVGAVLPLGNRVFLLRETLSIWRLLSANTAFIDKQEIIG